MGRKAEMQPCAPKRRTTRRNIQNVHERLSRRTGGRAKKSNRSSPTPLLQTIREPVYGFPSVQKDEKRDMRWQLPIYPEIRSGTISVGQLKESVFQLKKYTKKNQEADSVL